MVVKQVKENKKKNYYDVTIGDETYLLHEETILKYRIVKDKELSIYDIKNIIKDNDKEVVYSKTLNYILKYPQSKKNLKKHLELKYYDNDTINYVIFKLEENKLLNDLQLAESLIVTYVNSSYGINMIKSKLYEKGFNSNDIDAVIKTINYEDYNNSLKKLIKKNENRYKNKDNANYKLINYLCSRGYLISEIKDILNV